MTTAEELVKYTKRSLKNKLFVVAVQREPYIHVHTPHGIQIEKTAGGVHLLLDGIVKQVGGLMVAIGSGNADDKVVDEKGRFNISSKDPTYILKRVFLKKKEHEGFYYGFANQTLWPLCHVTFVKPIFSAEWWEEYVKVNQKFADAILEEVGDQDAFIWINDYHLALLPKMLKDRNPQIKIGTFWHIPWPTYEVFRICPWRKEIIEGLLGSDFVGLHRGYHVENLIECARRELGVIVDSEPRSVTYQNHNTKLDNLPAGIDYHEIKAKLDTQKEPTPKLIEKDFGFTYEHLAIGVDRIDYTKGIPERLRIIDRFLDKYSEFKEKFVYLSIGAPSRIKIPAYQSINKEIKDLIGEINAKHGTKGWKPIRFVNEVLPRERIFQYYQLSDVCMVTSLDDGMNLVAKEYVICAKSDKGMLMLSKFTGAAKDLRSAILINPYDLETSVDALYKALTMQKEERTRRMNEMKTIVKEYNIYNWAMKFIEGTLTDY